MTEIKHNEYWLLAREMFIREGLPLNEIRKLLNLNNNQIRRMVSFCTGILPDPSLTFEERYAFFRAQGMSRKTCALFLGTNEHNLRANYDGHRGEKRESDQRSYRRARSSLQALRKRLQSRYEARERELGGVQPSLSTARYQARLRRARTVCEFHAARAAEATNDN